MRCKLRDEPAAMREATHRRRGWLMLCFVLGVGCGTDPEDLAFEHLRKKGFVDVELTPVDDADGLFRFMATKGEETCGGSITVASAASDELFVMKRRFTVSHLCRQVRPGKWCTKPVDSSLRVSRWNSRRSLG